MEFYNKLSDSVNPPVNQFLDAALNGTPKPGEFSNIGFSFFKMLLVLYAAVIAPKLPTIVLEALDNVPSRIVMLSLVMWTGSHDPTTSILVAVAFYATLNAMNGKTLFEKFGGKRNF